MTFSSIIFIYFFLPLALLLSYLTKGKKWQNAILVIISLLFFAWGAPKFVFALIALCAADWLLSKAMVHRPERANFLCAFGVSANLAVLAIFKYTGFATNSINALLAACGIGTIPVVSIALPLGISFFTFQKISYLMDVKRGVSKPAESFCKYLLYISLFPQLILGPIIRYHDIEDQLDRRLMTAEGFLSGVWRFSLGFARKMLIAGPLAAVADAAFRSVASGQLPSCASAWLGLWAYTLQIYFDFAGYSDMAVGIGRMLGFRFPENFDAPYISRDMAEFWRRWHMTLGGFMKEYLYIPLGGNRCSKTRALFNNWLVFLVSGFWHGASWNFVIWGAWHGFWITISKLFGSGRRKSAPTPRNIVPIVFTLLLAMLGWVFFRATDFTEAIRFFKCLIPSASRSASVICDVRAATAMAVGTVMAFIPLFAPRLGIADWNLPEGAPGWKVALRTSASLLLTGLATLPLLVSGFNPFIYFRF